MNDRVFQPSHTSTRYLGRPLSLMMGSQTPQCQKRNATHEFPKHFSLFWKHRIGIKGTVSRVKLHVSPNLALLLSTVASGKLLKHLQASVLSSRKWANNGTCLRGLLQGLSKMWKGLKGGPGNIQGHTHQRLYLL